MTKHKGPPADESNEPLPKRRDTPITPIPDGGPRPVSVGSEHRTECFRCGDWPCTCPTS